MNNEPVAWINKRTNKCVVFINTPPSDDWIPLYTHPVKELDEQFKKGFEAGKEEGWKAHKFHHPVKEQDESFDRTASHMAGEYVSHPVKEQDTDCQYCKQGCIRCDARKQLTDAEIRTIQDMCHLKNVGYNNFIMRFARAILRKASEK